MVLEEEEEGNSPNPVESASILQAFFLRYLQKPDHLPISTSLPVPLMPKLSNISLVFILSMYVRFLNPGLLESIPSSFVSFLFCFFFFFLVYFFPFGPKHPAIFLKWSKEWGKRSSQVPFLQGCEWLLCFHGSPSTVLVTPADSPYEWVSRNVSLLGVWRSKAVVMPAPPHWGLY